MTVVVIDARCVCASKSELLSQIVSQDAYVAFNVMRMIVGRYTFVCFGIYNIRDRDIIAS